MSVKYNGFVYQWTNTRNGKKYIGSHYGSEDDNYIGSGIYFKRAYKKNPEEFERTILEYVLGSHPDLLLREQYYLDQVEDIVTNQNYYNCSPNAKGGYNHGHLTEEKQREIIMKAVQASLDSRNNMTKAQKKDLKLKKQNTWSLKKQKHLAHAERTRQRRLDEENSKTDVQRKLFQEKMKEVYWNRPQDQIDEHNANIAKGVEKWHATKSPAKEKARMEKVVQTKKLLDLRWVHNPKSQTRMQIPSIEIPIKEKEGWVRGMGPKKNFKRSIP